MDKRIYFVILIGLIICTFFWWVIPNRNDTQIYSGDFLFHYGKSAGKTTDELITMYGAGLNSVENFNSYPSLFHFLAQLFSLRIEFFLIFSLTIFFVLFPLLLSWASENWTAGLFWIASSAPFFFAFGAIAQGIITLFLIPFVFANKIVPKRFIVFFRVFLLFLSILIHSHGWFLLAGFWVVEIIFYLDWKNILLFGCFLPKTETLSAVESTEKMVEHTGINIVGKKGLLSTGWIEVPRWFLFNPLSIAGFYGLWLNHKKFLFFVIVIFCFGISFLWLRVIESAAPFIAIGISEYYLRSKKFMRMVLIIFALLLIIMFFLHQLSLMNYLTFSFTGAIDCALHGFGTW